MANSEAGYSGSRAHQSTQETIGGYVPRLHNLAESFEVLSGQIGSFADRVGGAVPTEVPRKTSDNPAPNSIHGELREVCERMQRVWEGMNNHVQRLGANLG